MLSASVLLIMGDFRESERERKVIVGIVDLGCVAVPVRLPCWGLLL